MIKKNLLNQLTELIGTAMQTIWNLKTQSETNFRSVIIMEDGTYI
jgi:hypothetical protein